MHFYEQNRMQDLSNNYLIATDVILTIVQNPIFSSGKNFFWMEYSNMLIRRLQNDNCHPTLSTRLN